MSDDSWSMSDDSWSLVIARVIAIAYRGGTLTGRWQIINSATGTTSRPCTMILLQVFLGATHLQLQVRRTGGGLTRA